MVCEASMARLKDTLCKKFELALHWEGTGQRLTRV